MFAAVNTVEPPILDLANPRWLRQTRPWAAERWPAGQDRVRQPLGQLSGI